MTPVPMLLLFMNKEGLHRVPVWCRLLLVQIVALFAEEMDLPPWKQKLVNIFLLLQTEM